MRPAPIIALARAHLRPILAACLLTACSGPGSGGDAAPSESATTLESLPPDEPAATAVSTLRPRGLWVLAEGTQRVLEDRLKLAPLVDHATALGASDLFVQVYRGGRGWYDGSLADHRPYSALVAANGVDTLRELIALAHARGLRVHAWVNVLSLSQNRNAPFIEAVGRDAVLVDRHGRSLLDYPGLEVPPPDGRWYRMGTRGVYLDPAAPGVRERLVATFVELLQNYPELDGLHLDYIRHPDVLPFVPGSRFGVGLDFGYGTLSRLRFQHETGLTGPYRDAEAPSSDDLVNADAWDDWRRGQVTALVAEIRAASLAARPGLLLSAAVIGYVDRAYLSLAQDWLGWLEDGLIDFAIPMAYTRDDRLLRYQLERFGHVPNADRIWAGLGSWLFAREPERALRQIRIAEDAGTTGDALFSYDSIVDTPALLEALVASLQRAPEAAP